MTEDQSKSHDDAEETFGPEQSAIERVRSARPVKRTAGPESEGVESTPAIDDLPTGEGATVFSGRAARPTKVAGAPKGRQAVRRDTRGEVSERRVGPVEFSRQSAAELRKVIWPTGEQLSQYFVVVLVFVLFIITFVGLLDLFFGWGLLKLLGN
ncbi:MAG TPA: preprotein translocase subunit SecE [Propionibacteriaceae bacterium]|nr:preprotein translocase subunit SecE [Propionibacteriaceae bacterium]